MGGNHTIHISSRVASASTTPPCPHDIKRTPRTTTLSIHCHACPHHAATLNDPTCRTHLQPLLTNEPHTTELILNHTIVSVYTTPDLTTITQPSTIHETPTDYQNEFHPYIRPSFIDSYVHLHPPPDAVFHHAYDTHPPHGRPLHITIYTLTTRPEKLYFTIPPEYTLPKPALHLLQHTKTFLATHRPTDTSFLDTTHTDDYFTTLATTTINHLQKNYGLHLTPEQIDELADIYTRYTAGLGILQDLLTDHHIQDIYINAPAHHNPIHLVCDGEEYTTNLYLSTEDIDALASKFRAHSARAFSEATPVLDMDLPKYHTRIAAISNPLTPHGIAFALRRHRPHPWTLAHLVANHMISPHAAGLLSFLVDGQATLLIAGSRGAGKTSLLTALLLEIPQRFRILTIEDTPEIPTTDLQTLGYKLQSLITKSIVGHSSTLEVDPAEALRTALRLGESVLILGEVRGLEAKILFEAMRIGAAGNLIMGTIHGSTTRDVYERVVYDIGVPPTSFKAVDAVVIAAPIRSGGGMERRRRVTQVSETVKTEWSMQPDPEKVFHDLMVFDARTDQLCATGLLEMGQSMVVGGIAKKWGISITDALGNIAVRTHMKSVLAEYGRRFPVLLEAAAVRDANNAFWLAIERRGGGGSYEVVRQEWDAWFQDYVGRV